MREAPTGATRDTENTKPQYEGYLSPMVLWRFGQYMLKHQSQADGITRTSDNWQKGMPREWYADSMYRHFMDVMLFHDNHPELMTESIEEALCALLFNVQGYLYEILLNRSVQDGD